MQGETNKYNEPGDNQYSNFNNNFNNNFDNNHNNNNQNNIQWNTQNQNYNNIQNHNQNYDQNGYIQNNPYNQPNTNFNQNYNTVNNQGQGFVQPITNNQIPQVMIVQGVNPPMKDHNGYYLITNKGELDYLINNPNITAGFNDPRHPESYRVPYYNVFDVTYTRNRRPHRHLSYVVHTKCSNCNKLTYTSVIETANCGQLCYYMCMFLYFLYPCWFCFMACRNKEFGFNDYTYTCSSCSHVHKKYNTC